MFQTKRFQSTALGMFIFLRLNFRFPAFYVQLLRLNLFRFSVSGSLVFLLRFFPDFALCSNIFLQGFLQLFGICNRILLFAEMVTQLVCREDSVRKLCPGLLQLVGKFCYLRNIQAKLPQLRSAPVTSSM